MKIAVAGVVGRVLLPLLTEAGRELMGLTRSASKLKQIEQSGAAAVIADVYDRDRLFGLLADYRLNVVIHQLTALSGWNLANNARMRIERTRNLVNAALAAEVPRMIVQSISWAYGPGESVATEKDRLDEEAPMPRKISGDGAKVLRHYVSSP